MAGGVFTAPLRGAMVFVQDWIGVLDQTGSGDWRRRWGGVRWTVARSTPALGTSTTP